MARKNTYAKRLQAQRAGRTMFLTQMCKDAALIAANEALGMGEGRCIAFSEAFDRVFNEIVRVCLEDTPDIEYTKDVIDRQLRAICGKHWQPWEIRYKEGKNE